MALRAALFVVLLGGSFCVPLPAAKNGEIYLQETPFGTGAVVGLGLVRYHNTCVSFHAVFISGDFFKKLYVHRTPNTLEFRRKKEKTTYVNFPEPLLVDVWAFPRKCTAEMIPPDYASGLMKGPSFKAAWKRGDEIRPVDLLETQQHHDPLRSVGWSYLLTVPSGNVPLTDSLIIEVSLRNGLCQIQLTANLDSRLRRLAPSTCH